MKKSHKYTLVGVVILLIIWIISKVKSKGQGVIEVEVPTGTQKQDYFDSKALSEWQRVRPMSPEAIAAQAAMPNKVNAIKIWTPEIPVRTSGRKLTQAELDLIALNVGGRG